MSRELMKTISVSLTSSLCTAMFVVACTAAATDGDKGGGSGGDGSGDVSGDDGDDGGLADLIQDVAEMSATIAAQQASIVELELFKSSSLCFIGHMTDDQYWSDGTEDFNDLCSDCETSWDQGLNSDAQQAYDDCF